MDAPALLNADVTFKQAFEGMGNCAAESSADETARDQWLVQSTKKDGEGYSVYSSTATYVCKSTWDLASFTAGKPTGKKNDKPFKFSYTWVTQDDTTAGEWCYFRTYLPKTFSGGLIMTNTQDKDT